MPVSRRPTHTSLPGGATRAIRPRPIRIVVAESQALFRAAIRNVIDSEPDLQLVGETGDSREVPELVAALKPSVLLVDVRMTHLETLRSTPSKIVVLADSDEPQHLSRAQELGASAVVGKQAPTKELISAIRRIAGGSEPPPAPDPAERRLSKREREIAVLVAQGLRNCDIADKLFISAPTVKNHVHNIFRKLGIWNRRELALYARDEFGAEPDQVSKPAEAKKAEPAAGRGPAKEQVRKRRYGAVRSK